MYQQKLPSKFSARFERATYKINLPFQISRKKIKRLSYLDSRSAIKNKPDPNNFTNSRTRN